MPRCYSPQQNRPALPRQAAQDIEDCAAAEVVSPSINICVDSTAGQRLLLTVSPSPPRILHQRSAPGTPLARHRDRGRVHRQPRPHVAQQLPA